MAGFLSHLFIAWLAVAAGLWLEFGRWNGSVRAEPRYPVLGLG